MSDDSPRLVTGAMLGVFLAFGVDLVVIVAALWYVGRVSATVAAGTALGVVAAFSLWVAVRWVRLRSADDGAADGAATATEPADEDPVNRLKRRYADGEITDEEFERRVDRLLDADSRAESRTEAAPEPEFESK